MTRLDVTGLVNHKADIEKVNIFPDEDNNYAIFVKARNEKPVTMYPAKEDITLYFNSLKDPAGDKVRSEIGQKYYQLAKEHPELKKDLLTIDTGNVDLKRISKVSLFKPNNSSHQVMISATIDGEKQPAREVSIGAWNRFWLTDDQDKYKAKIASSQVKEMASAIQNEAVEPQEPQSANGTSEQIVPKIIKRKLPSEFAEYFNAPFKGIGPNNINYYDRLEDSLTDPAKKRSTIEYAKIALFIYQSKKILPRKKPNTFSEWYQYFCKIVGCKYNKDYSPHKLPITQKLKEEFSYLLD